MNEINIKDRINSFNALGRHISELLEDYERNKEDAILAELTRQAFNQNTWFTSESVVEALKGILKFLDQTVLENWLSTYSISENRSPKVIGTLMAGNIPLVGFHDLLCVLLSGNVLKAKLSSQDTVLMKYLANQLIAIEPRWKSYLIFSEQLKEIDALIATGSDNTARHFNYYFRHIPRIIRKNRTACAILEGNESKTVLADLAKDVFTYFGLGCRNVTKLYVPENYNFETILHVFEERGKTAALNHKYVNNYDYNKSILLVNGVPHLDNGFILLKEDTSLFSPISMLHFEKYESIEELEKKLQQQKDQIQCILSGASYFNNSIAIGNAQSPTVSDYADGVDTMAFLKSID